MWVPFVQDHPPVKDHHLQAAVARAERDQVRWLGSMLWQTKCTVLTRDTLSVSYRPAWTFYIALQQWRRCSTYDSSRNRLCWSSIRGSASFANLFGLRLRRRLRWLCSRCRSWRCGRIRVRLRRRIRIPLRNVAGGFFVHLPERPLFGSQLNLSMWRAPLSRAALLRSALLR